MLSDLFDGFLLLEQLHAKLIHISYMFKINNEIDLNHFKITFVIAVIS